jgi:polyadenylate-binding protein
MAEHEPQGHPYLHEPRIYITGLPAWVEDANLASAFQHCSPFRPNIQRDGGAGVVSGTIDFRFLEKGAHILTVCIYILNSRPKPRRRWRRCTGGRSPTRRR